MIYDIPNNPEFTPLTGEEKRDGKRHTSRTGSIWKTILPVPENASEPIFKHSKYGRPVAKYFYKNSDGDFLGYTCRYEYKENGLKKKAVLPLTYCQNKDTQRARWQFRIWDGTRPLYGQELLKKKPDATVIVVEGEKAVRVGRKSCPDYVWVTSPGGARAAACTDWSVLQGRKVIIWRDNDEAGMQYQQEVTFRLQHFAAAIDILDLPSNLIEGWDVADAATEGWTSKRITSFIQKHCRTLEKEILTKVTLDEFIHKKIKPREMILSPIIPEKGAVMAHAYRGVGKTHIALGIAYAVATGGKFLKWRAKTPRKVLLIDGEMPEHTLQERLKALIKSDKMPPHPEYFQIIAHDFQENPMPSLSTEQGQALIDKHLEGVDLLILDNLSTLCSDVKENEGDSWVPVQKWLLELRRRKIAVLIIHHSGKNRLQRGSSRKEDILDTVIMLDRPEDYEGKEGARFTVHYEKARGLFGKDADPFEAELEIVDNKAVWHVFEIQDKQADRILEFKKKGLSVRKIAEKLNMASSTVQYRVDKLKMQGKL